MRLIDAMLKPSALRELDLRLCSGLPVRGRPLGLHGPLTLNSEIPNPYYNTVQAEHAVIVPNHNDLSIVLSKGRQLCNPRRRRVL